MGKKVEVQRAPNKYELSEPNPEYIVVADDTSEVLLSTRNKEEALNLVGFIRRGGGAVTVFMSTGI